jgi:hypothetical protein
MRWFASLLEIVVAASVPLGLIFAIAAILSHLG